MNDHKNIRPYQCHLCDKSYRNSFDCQQHVRKTHGINTSHGNSIPPTEPPNAAQAAQAAAAAAAAEKFRAAQLEAEKFQAAQAAQAEKFQAAQVQAEKFQAAQAAAAAAAAAEKFHRPAEYPTLGDHWSKFS